ncbi:carbohydrate ABC transporter permease [Paenibacillus humicola]|uniref:carbohydrate ABC transporter permease n=1 Tax=Paenibacillus humicola TaxID=3110540 RepID=UPI00237B43E1|nr:carbohydrate ABC transporter permease [Paenibacillus humicola]
MNQPAAVQAMPRPAQAGKAGFRISTVVKVLLSLAWWLFTFYPIFYILFTSFHGQEGFLVDSVWLPPAHPTFQNYIDVMHSGFVRYFANSLIVSVVSVVCIVVFSLTASYVLVKVTTAATKFIFNLILTALAIPLQALIIPVYSMIYHGGMYDTYWGLILPSIAFGLPLTILIMVNFVRDIPAALYDAMVIDGVGEYGLLIRLIVPLTVPALFAVGIYQFIGVWNNFLFPLVLTQSENMRLLPLAVVSFVGEHSVDIPAIMAAVVLSALPLILGYIFSRRYLLMAMSSGLGASK